MAAFEAIARTPGAQAVFALTRAYAECAEIERMAQQWRTRCRHLVVIGSGGSGLSSRALAMLKTGRRMASPTHAVHVLDTLDAQAFEVLLQSLPLAETCVLAVSKSGSTVETYAQAHALFTAMKSAGADLANNAAVLTVEGENPLRSLAAKYHIPALPHDPQLGGRFSLLSAAGLLPASFIGLNTGALCEGAASVLSPAGMTLAGKGAAWLHGQSAAGRNIAVMLPYGEQLLGLALWWRQGFAESLGKDGKGATPLACLGTRDQHSQLQLWLDGPDDKCFTLMLPESVEAATRLEGVSGSLHYLNGHSLADLASAQAHATAETLLRHGRPIRVFRLKQADEYAFGALAMHVTLEILHLATFMQVNPFDQPAVEESKRLAHSYLTEKGA